MPQSSAPDAASLQRSRIISRADVVVDGAVTRLVLTSDGPITFQLFTLADPYRVIVDLPLAEVRLPPAAGRISRGLITAFRFGLFAADRSRFVIDTAGPIKVRAGQSLPGKQGGGQHRLAIELEAVARDDFIALAPPPSTRDPSAALMEQKVIWPKLGPAKPVVVIDPGHGGVDPGATAPVDNIQEKDIALAVARQLAAALTTSGRYDVRMTRSNDIFLSLDQRVRSSSQVQAQLFISLHADSLADPQFAQTARGLAVYTLSERASNRAAQASADKENAADSQAGVDTLVAEGDDQVKSILFDLTKRETQIFSNNFKSIALDRLRAATALAKDPGRSAAFRVLKQAESPSVLIELGYLSNPTEAKQMVSPAWQAHVSRAIAGAVDAYFARIAGK